jgi:hypothetical protein
MTLCLGGNWGITEPALNEIEGTLQRNKNVADLKCVRLRTLFCTHAELFLDALHE